MEKNKTEIKITNTSDELRGIIAPEILDEYTGSEGYLRENTEALVLYENKRACAFLILERKGENAVVPVMSPSDKTGKLSYIFSAAVNYARALNLKAISVTTDTGEYDTLIKELKATGFKEDKKPAVRYLIKPTGNSINRSLLPEKLQKVRPFYELPMDIMAGIDSETDIYAGADDIIAVRPELCVAYVDENKLQGYILCELREDELKIFAGYIKNHDEDILDTLLVSLNFLKAKLHPEVRRLCVPDFSENTFEILKKYFKESDIDEKVELNLTKQLQGEI